MSEDNPERILRGEQFIDLIPEPYRQRMVDKRIVRVVKAPDGTGSFETIEGPDEAIKLAGRPGHFDLSQEYGVDQKLVEALDITSQLAIAAGLDALREAGIPLTMQYRRTTTGSFLPDRWMLPESLREETGVIFCSAFPGLDRLADELTRYYRYRNIVDQLELIEEVRQSTTDTSALEEIGRREDALRKQLEQDDYHFDRRFLFRILSQFFG